DHWVTPIVAQDLPRALELVANGWVVSPFDDANGRENHTGLDWEPGRPSDGERGCLRPDQRRSRRAPTVERQNPRARWLRAVERTRSRHHTPWQEECRAAQPAIS